jgi:hypothetical protein
MMSIVISGAGEAPDKIGDRKIEASHLIFLSPIFCPTAETTTRADKKRLFAADHSFLERDLCEQP